MSDSKTDPTPDEILAACKRIQASWSPQVRATRKAGLSREKRREIRLVKTVYDDTWDRSTPFGD